MSPSPSSPMPWAGGGADHALRRCLVRSGLLCGARLCLLGLPDRSLSVQLAHRHRMEPLAVARIAADGAGHQSAGLTVHGRDPAWGGISMDPITLGIIVAAALILLMAIGTPIAFALGGV